MENDLSLFDLQLIQSLIRKNTDEEIAEIIGRPVALISEYTLRFSSKNHIVSKQLQVEEKKREKEWKLLQKHKKEADEAALLARKNEQKKRRQIRQEEVFRNRKPPQQSYGTAKVDYSKKILVRIDRKTAIYVEPGTDIEEFKKKYQERMELRRQLISPKNYKEVKKFKPLK